MMFWFSAKWLSCSVCSTSAAALVAAAVPAAAFAATPITIMPIGDSITAGTVNGGYRAPMATSLVTSGFSPTLIGSQTDTSQIAAYQHHEGHGGWRLDQLASDLTGYGYDDPSPGTPSAHGGYWLTGGHNTGRSAVSPNVVTVLGGINDINGFYGNNAGAPSFTATSSSNPMSTSANTAYILSTIESRMSTLVSTLVTALPNATVMVCSTIPYANGFLDSTITGATDAQRATWATQDGVNAAQEYGVNHYVILFDKWLKNTFVPQEMAAGYKANYVDEYSNFVLPDGSVRGWTTPSDAVGPSGYGDYGLHPNQFGYNLMGATLSNAIAGVVPEPASLGVLAIGAAALWRRRPGKMR